MCPCGNAGASHMCARRKQAGGHEEEGQVIEEMLQVTLAGVATLPYSRRVVAERVQVVAGGLCPDDKTRLVAK